MTAPATTPAATLARIRRAVRAAITACGGIDGAAATTGKSRSLVGGWNARDCSSTPTLADAFALDDVVRHSGHRPPITAALAAEMGCVLIVLPDPCESGEGLALSFATAAAEFGQIAERLRDALRDGHLNRAEGDVLVAEIDDAQAALAAMRALAERTSHPARPPPH